MKRLIVVAGLALFFCHHSSFATVQVMDFRFSGIDWEPDGISADATVRLRFDDSTHDDNPDPNIGSYKANLVILSSGGSSGQGLFPVTVTVQNSAEGAGDDVFSMSQADFPSPFVDVDGQLVSGVSFSLTSSSGKMFSSDALPVDPDFASNTSVELLLSHGDSTQPFFPPPPEVLIRTIPEPSSYALLAAGMLSLFALRRLRRK